ncbi:hypothetical protein Ct61P_05731 [Colletotrichum tofieldiae]|nr:hypothetical protein Ct61P_05731 [Colletotrichum tofieldiae]
MWRDKSPAWAPPMQQLSSWAVGSFAGAFFFLWFRRSPFHSWGPPGLKEQPPGVTQRSGLAFLTEPTNSNAFAAAGLDAREDRVDSRESLPEVLQAVQMRERHGTLLGLGLSFWVPADDMRQI